MHALFPVYKRCICALYVMVLCMCVYICCALYVVCVEIDLDVDNLLPFQVDKLNVIALDYGVQPGAYSKSVSRI